MNDDREIDFIGILKVKPIELDDIRKNWVPQC